MTSFTPEQLEARRQTLGASEIPCVLGISPYKSRFELWLEKRGLAPDRAEDTPWQRMGLRMEPVLAEMYVEQMLAVHGQVVTLDGDGRTPVQIGGTPWACTPDRLVACYKAAEFWGVDFKKSRYGEGYGAPGTEEVPGHVYAQCQWSMFVTDHQRWDVAVLIGGDDFRMYHVMRNDEFLRAAVAEAEEFWACVAEGVEPPLDGSRGAKAYLQARFPEDVAMDPLPVVDDPATVDLMQSLAANRKLAKEVEERIATAENRIKRLIGDRPGIVTPAGRATWKRTKDTRKTDWEAVVRVYHPSPDLLDRYTEVRPGTRRFLFTAATPTTEDSA